MNKQESITRGLVSDMMHRHGGRLLRDLPTHDAGDVLIQFWSIDGNVVIVQYWKQGGCSHYLPGNGSTWAQFEKDIAQFQRKGETTC